MDAIQRFLLFILQERAIRSIFIILFHYFFEIKSFAQSKMTLHRNYSFEYKDSFWFKKYRVYLLKHLFLLIDFFSKFNQFPILLPENFLMNLCDQIFSFIQQKKVMKNQQVTEVSFRHFLARLVALEYEKMLNQFNHLPHYLKIFDCFK